MPFKSSNPRSDARKMASLSIVWGAVAAAAYFGLVLVAVNLVKQATGWPGPGNNIDAGLIKLNHAAPGQGPSSLFTIAVAALPIAIAVSVGLGLAARIRPSLTIFSALIMAAGVVGLAGAILLLVDNVVNVPKNRTDFAVAIGTIVAVPILLRIQRFVRRFYRRTPAVSSLIFAALLAVYLFLSNGTSISSIVLTDIDIWIALAAFAIVLYAGFKLARLAPQVRKAG